MKKFSIDKYRNLGKTKDRYAKQLLRLRKNGFEIDKIETTVENAESKLKNGVNSFVIYGDPQSGKTEMMIALTARLLDAGNKIVIVLINDNVGLLEQNLRRFSKAALDPDPKNYKEILDDAYKIKDYNWIIFCKKNSSDLQQLIKKVGDFPNKIIIDDEADYASPNGKKGRKEKTTINDLIEKLIGKNGKYIGVTATPARLDLNNTFDNCNKEWVYFPSHSAYIGQDSFFPADLKNSKLPYQLTLIPEDISANDDPQKYLREALFKFLVNVAFLNLKNIKEGKEEKYYSMLIHTSGKTKDHMKDHDDIVSILNILKDESIFDKYVETIYNIAKEKYGKELAHEITEYILKNRNRNAPIIINNKKDKENLEKAANPKALFTIAIGGNIISRGVTFKNLLSMFFTRTVKSKLQQDTYIQRARMFGARSNLEFFELTIPEKLYEDWHRCFIFHKLALVSTKKGNPPVWIEDGRIKAVAQGSIDKATVITNSGELRSESFRYTKEIEEIIASGDNSIKKIEKIRNFLGGDVIPKHVVDFIKAFSPDGIASLAIHNSSDISGWGKDADKDDIYRGKGFIGKGDLKKFPDAIHHIKIFYNSSKKARLFYKFIGISGTKFLKNIK